MSLSFGPVAKEHSLGLVAKGQGHLQELHISYSIYLSPLSNFTCVRCHISCVVCLLSPVTYYKRQQPQAKIFPLLTPPQWAA